MPSKFWEEWSSHSTPPFYKIRRYEIPLDDFLRQFKYFLMAMDVKHLWTAEELNGYNRVPMPGFFCDGNAGVAEDIMEVL